MNICAIIQARMSSTRLPGKVFEDIGGKPLIWHVVNRLSPSRRISQIVLATSVNPQDDVLEAWAAENKIQVYRGSEEDVLARYFEAARKYKADVIVRITADDPFKDPYIADDTIALFLEQKADIASNNNPPSFPEGLDVEVFSFEKLKEAHEKAILPYEREHVTQYFYKNAGVKKVNLTNDTDLSFLRWTLDTPLDLKMTREVYRHLYREGKVFTTKEILELLDKHPEIAEINMNVERSLMYKK